MSTSGLIPSLMLFTLVAVLVIAAVSYALFLRKRGNRHPTEKPELAGQTMAKTEADRRT